MLVQLSKLSISFVKIMKPKFSQNFDDEFFAQAHAEESQRDGTCELPLIIFWVGRL